MMKKQSGKDLTYVICRPGLSKEMLQLSRMESVFYNILCEADSMPYYQGPFGWFPYSTHGGILAFDANLPENKMRLRSIGKALRGGIDTSFTSLDRTGSGKDDTGYSYSNHFLRLYPIESTFGRRIDRAVDQLRVTPEHIDGWGRFPELVFELSRKTKNDLLIEEAKNLLCFYGIETEDVTGMKWKSTMSELHLRESLTVRLALTDLRLPIEPVLAALAMSAFIIREQHSDLRAAHLIGELEGRCQFRPIWFMNRRRSEPS